jgi:hypothetical protein
MFRFDHLAVSAATLQDGVAYVEDRLGVPLAPGGDHPAMGTHNRLLGLGPHVYLEVIAINPQAPDPGRPRWFDLDSFTGPPRPTNWIVRTDDLDAALARAPDGSGTPMALRRGDLNWRMAVPADGALPFDGGFPALIEWQGTVHPAARLPDQGCRLRSLDILHPDADSLRAALRALIGAALGDDVAVSVRHGPAPALHAAFDTPHGPRSLA